MTQKEIGSTLRILRGVKSVEVIAHLIGVSVKTYQAYESGARNPSDPVKIRIAHLYGKTVGELFFGESNT